MPSGPPKNIPSAAIVTAAVLIEAALVAIGILNLPQNVGGMVAVLLATSILYILSVFWILKVPQSRPVSLVLILFSSLVFRLTLFPLPSVLSDDLYRYRWEGKLLSNGGNPYATAPHDAAARPLDDATYPSVDGKDFRAVYGPLVELNQGLTYRIVSSLIAGPERQVFWFKTPAALADLAAIAALLALLRARKLPLERILIYCWCPLPMVVFWWTGHNDAFVVLFIALALAAAAKERLSMAYLWLSLAAAAKIWPILLFPAFIRWRWRQILVALVILGAVGALAILPFGLDAFSNRNFASGFLGGWRNNDSVFGIVLALVKDPYRAKHITFAMVAITAVVISFTRMTLERKAMATAAALLLFSSNVHPWYATWLLPALVVDTVPAALLFVSLVPVFYESVITWKIAHVWNGLSWLRWPVYAGVMLTLLVSSLQGRRSKSTAALPR